ncbi:MAG: hypothetical protein ACPL7G_01035, partial [Chloroflexia bacterium]
MAIQGRYAYVAFGGLYIIDVSDPRNPYKAGSSGIPGHAIGVAVSGAYAYVAAEDAGLRIVDVSNPRAPHEAGFYDT